MVTKHCPTFCMNTLRTISHQGIAGCRRMLPYKVHCIHAIWNSMYHALHCTDAMYSVMWDCHTAYMALRIRGWYCIRIMHHLWQTNNTPYMAMFQCMPSCTVPRVTTILEISANISPAWHQTSSDVIKCHIKHCLSTGCHCLILHNRNQTMERNWLHRTTVCCERCAAIRRKRILCSSEQSKLCLRPTKSILSDKDQPARYKPGDLLQSRKSYWKEECINSSNI